MEQQKTMRAAVIDIGSSSVKLIIGESAGDEIKILESLKNIIEIGKSTFYEGRISQAIFKEVIDVLGKYKDIIRGYDVSDIRVIATTAVREANNKDIFLDTIARKTGFQIEVLNVGDVVYYIDAFLSYRLKRDYPIHEKNLLIAELGAGSLDISLMEKGYTLTNFGIPIGTLRLKQLKGKLAGSHKETYEALNEHVENEITNVKKVFPRIKIDDIILIDESYSSCLQNILPNKKRESNFFQFKFRESKQFLSKVTDGNLDALSHRLQIPIDIAESIDAYAVILNKLFKLIKGRSLYILETSLSEALLANILFNVELSKKYNKTKQLVSMAKFLCRKYDADLKHNKHVAYLSEELFHLLKDTLGLKDDEVLYLLLAAYLHNIGTFINNRAHHKHSEYIIHSLSFFRLTEQEIKIIACVARYHRKAIPQKTHFLYNSLSPEYKILVQKLSSLLRMANALDISRKQKVNKIEMQISQKQEISLNVFTSQGFTFEKVNFQNMKSLFEDTSGNKINLVVKKQS